MQRIRQARLAFEGLSLRRADVIAAALVLSVLLTINGLAVLLPEPPIGPLSAHLAVANLVGACLALLSMASAAFGLRARFARAAEGARRAINATNTDPLTGAYARAYFLAEFEIAVDRGKSALGYIQLDMDNLKLLNDGNGHAAGDAALRALIERVRKVAPHALIGRLGGDEFGIALPGIREKSELAAICARILEQLGQPVAIAGRNMRIGATMGYALSPADAHASDELMSCADLALYEGKSSGRNLAIGFDPDMLRERRHQRFIERELRAAILMNQLAVHYQPIFDIETNELLTYEALVRWEHPVRGIIPPSEFIHIAERSDLIDKLGEWVMRKACIDRVTLDAPAISVNASVAQLRRPDFAERVARVLLETGTLPEQLTIEVTETVPLDAGGTEITNLQNLRARNVKIAIDDFGAGNASVSYLKRSSFDTVKIDRSYISAIVDNPLDSMMVEAICRIGQAMGMRVIAEGVETEEQLAVVRALGCTAVQGYLLGRPQPLRTLVRRRNGKGLAA